MIGFALTAKRLYNELLIVGASILLASAASSFWFIPAWGYSGAALTLAVTGATTLIVSFILLANSAHKVQAAKI
jgi:O-antigen/teichoic acid export membrane protein